MIRTKIDLLKLNGVKPFAAKDGTAFLAIPIEANGIYVGAKCTYMELTLMDNRDGRDQYDNDGFTVLDIGKARREAGEKGPILGNWKQLDGAPASGNRNPMGGTDRTAAEATRKNQQVATQAEDETDDIPF